MSNKHFTQALETIKTLTGVGPHDFALLHSVADVAAPWASESTGADPQLVNRLVQESVDLIQKDWLN